MTSSHSSASRGEPLRAPLSPKKTAHVDTWSREQLPPAAEWPHLVLDGAYAYPERLNAAVALLDRALEEGHGPRTALVTPDGAGGWTETTYADLAARVDAIAHVLRSDLGLVPGNRVLLRGFNGEWMAAAWLATLKAGMVAVATMPLLRTKELSVVIDRAKCQAALCDARLADELLAATRTKVALWGGDAGRRDDASAVAGTDIRAEAVSIERLMHAHAGGA